MGIWTDRVRNHDIWNSLQIVGALIDNVANVDFTVSPDSAEAIERLRQVLALTGKRLAATDPFIIDIQILDSLNTSFSEISSTLGIFISDSDESRLVTANVLVDTVISSLSRIPVPIPNDDLTVINELLTTFRSNVTEYTKAEKEDFELVNTKLSEINSALATHEKQILEEQNRLGLLNIEQQTQFSGMQDTRASEFSVAMSEFQKEFVNTKLSNQEQVNQQLSEFDKKLNQLHSRMTSQHEKSAKAYKEDLAELRKTYGDTAEEMLAEIINHRKEVEELVGIIGNLGVTSGYLTEANIARKRLYVWQILTVFALAGLVWVAYLMAFPPVTQSLIEQVKPALNEQFLFYQTLAARVFLSITFGIFAAYSARQAEKYMEMDRRNRKLALELAAVGPYIASLPDAMQDKFKLELGEKSFGVVDSIRHVQGKDPVSFLDIIKSDEVLEALEKIVKKIRGAES